MCRIVNGNLDKGLYPHNAKDHVIQALFISSHAELKRSLECEENPAFSLTMAVQNGAFFVGIWFWHLPSVGGFVLFEIWSHCVVWLVSEVLGLGRVPPLSGSIVDFKI